MLEITILPSGHLRCRCPGDGGDIYALERVAAVFARAGEGAGLVALAGLRTLEGLSMGAMFWRDFAGRFLRAFAAIAPETDAFLAAGGEDGAALADDLGGATPPPPPPETLRILLSAPPMLGAEYLTVSAFDGRWRAMDVWSRERCAELGGTAAFFLAHAPQCPVAGKVCFHLAERREESQPFALLTSYAAGADRGGAPIRVRLTAALAEKAPAAMDALRRAAAGSAVIGPLLASGRLFAPVPMSPDQAYAFLRETPRYEAAGVKVQVPDWWRERPLAQVTFSLGNASQERFTGDALLDCEVGLAVGEKALSPADAAALLEGGSGLRQIYGQWVEVDAEKLREVMGHWQQVKEKAGEGLTFGAAMRLLAGAGAADAEDADDVEATRRWSFVTAGERLRAFLDRIRPPAAARDGGGGPGVDGAEGGGAGRQKPLRFGGCLKATLRPYQEQGVRWLALLSRLGLGACLADDMGLGKTLQTIALLVLQKRRHERSRAKDGRPLRPTLLVAPASLLGNWRAELARFAPGLVCRFAHPAFCRRPLAELGEQAGAWLAGADVVVTTYAQLARLGWLQRRRWQLVVLDEAQAIKNPASRQARAVKALRARARVALTGTPVENRLGDLWSLFDFLNPGLLGSSHEFQAWAARMRHGGEGFAPLRRLVAPYILRRLKTDRAVISDLPDKIEVDAWCALSERQARLYRDHVERLARELEHCDALARRGLVLAYLMRFKQICNHPAQFAGEGFFAPEDSGKFLRLREIAAKAASRQEKMLIFTQFREMASPLAAFLRTIYGEEGLVLHGGTPAGERGRRVDAFQREDGPPFFVLSLKAGGTGLNLTAAAQVVHFDRWWNPAVENQATDRAYRIGQRRNVVVHKFVCGGTLEEKINALLRDKAAMAGELLGDGEGAPPALTELDNAELLRLVSLDLAAAAREE